MRAPAAVAILTLLLFGGAAVAIVLVGERVDCGGDPDWAAWRETGEHESEEGVGRRRDAAAHFMECRSLHGMTKREVRRRLGKPDGAGSAVRGDHAFLDYYLGPDGLGIDSELMSIEFDGSGHVVRVTVAQT